MSWVAVAIGAGAGLLKSEVLDRPAADKQRTLAAATQRYSPWTGLKAEPVKEADPMGSALTFGATGAQLGSGIQNSEATQGLMKAQTGWLNRGGSPNYTAAMTATASPGINYGQGGAGNYFGLSNPWTRPGSF